jgi:hypothetical protein
VKIPDEIRKAVAFVAFENKTTGEIDPVGSCFFLGHNAPEGQTTSPKMYVVTARHVIDKLQKKGVKETFLRLNSKSVPPPFLAACIPIEEWYAHPSDKTIEVAIFETGIPKDADHLVLAESMCATQAIFKQHEVELGDEVIISGLFQHHFGNNKNIPIVRVGNLAALNEERVSTELFGEIDAYLVEVRSTGGLSGSPVFLNLGVSRIIAGQVKHAKQPVCFLLGLIHGHFLDEPSAAINAGIAIVVPVESILATITEYERGAAKG